MTEDQTEIEQHIETFTDEALDRAEGSGEYRCVGALLSVPVGS